MITVTHTLQKSNSFAHGGSESGKITYLTRQLAIAGAFSTIAFQNPGGTRPVILVIGKQYTLSMWVYTPNANLIGSSDLPIVVAPKNWLTDPTAFWAGSNVIKTTVAACTDTWVQISFNFIYNGAPTFSFEIFGFDPYSEGVGVVQIDTGLRLRIGASAGSVNTNGLLFIDDVTLEEIIVCDLTLAGSPYSKTDETVAGAGDGTITINDVSTSYTPEFSIDNTNWFLSNHGASGYQFTGLLPGTYNVYVRDNSPAGCSQTITGITIVAGAAPGCDLAFDMPSFDKTNETITGHDGSITIHATSTNTPIQYSLDNVTFQMSNVFSGLDPGTYHVYVKDAMDCAIDVSGIIIYAYGALTTASINEAHVNRYNFIWWRQFTGEKGFNAVLCNGCPVDDIPNPYTLDKQKTFRHYPIAVPLEQFTFYANLDEPVVDPNYSQWRLALANQRGIVIDNIAPLLFDITDPSTFRFYADNIVIPNGYVGIFFLVVYSNVDNSLKFISNEIEVMNYVDTYEKFKSAKFVSTRVQFRNSYNLYLYNYETLPDFINKLRLRIYKVDEESEGTLTQYRAASTGILRNVAFELDKLLTLEAYWFDDYAHQAMFVLQAHDLLEMNGRPYIVQTLYKVTRDVRYNTNKGTLMVYDQNFSSANRYGQVEVVPDDELDGLVLGGDGGAIIGADSLTPIGL